MTTRREPGPICQCELYGSACPVPECQRMYGLTVPDYEVIEDDEGNTYVVPT